MARFLDRASLAIEMVAAAMLAAITVVVVASAVGRYGFARPIPDAFDLSRLLLGAAVMWGFASLGYRGSHIKLDLVAEILPAGPRRWVDILAWLVLLGFTALLVMMMYARVRSAFNSGEATFDLRLPVWPFYGLIWLGAVVSLITISARILMLWQGRGGLDAFEAVERPAEDGGNGNH